MKKLKAQGLAPEEDIKVDATDLAKKENEQSVDDGYESDEEIIYKPKIDILDKPEQVAATDAKAEISSSDAEDA